MWSFQDPQFWSCFALALQPAGLWGAPLCRGSPTLSRQKLPSCQGTSLLMLAEGETALLPICTDAGSGQGFWQLTVLHVNTLQTQQHLRATQTRPGFSPQRVGPVSFLAWRHHLHHWHWGRVTPGTLKWRVFRCAESWSYQPFPTQCLIKHALAPRQALHWTSAVWKESFWSKTLHCLGSLQESWALSRLALLAWSVAASGDLPCIHRDRFPFLGPR